MGYTSICLPLIEEGTNVDDTIWSATRYRASLIFQYITASASARQSSTWPRMHTIYSYHVTRRTKNWVLSYMGGSGCVTTASYLPPHISTVLISFYYCFTSALLHYLEWGGRPHIQPQPAASRPIFCCGVSSHTDSTISQVSFWFILLILCR